MKRATRVLAAAVLAAAPVHAQEVVEYVHLDALGSVRAVSNQANQVIERHDYLPFGEECTTGPCTANPGAGGGQPRKFTGKERDQETGLDYFGARYHGARIGRFTTVDPVYTWRENLADPQRWNRYAYVRNSPIRYTDPDGRLITPDTIIDVVSIAYDLFDIGRSINRGESTTATQWGALGADVAGTLLPVATGLGATVRGASKIDDVVDVTKVSKLPAEEGAGAGRFIVDPKGNTLIEPPGGKTVGNPDGTFVETRFANGSPAQQLHGPHRNYPQSHGHGFTPGPGVNSRGESLDVLGNVVPSNSPAAHWPVKD
jgi:RHS repeat-associated protein